MIFLFSIKNCKQTKKKNDLSFDKTMTANLKHISLQNSLYSHMCHHHHAEKEILLSVIWATQYEVVKLCQYTSWDEHYYTVLLLQGVFFTFIFRGFPLFLLFFALFSFENYGNFFACWKVQGLWFLSLHFTTYIPLTSLYRIFINRIWLLIWNLQKYHSSKRKIQKWKCRHSICEDTFFYAA